MAVTVEEQKAAANLSREMEYRLDHTAREIKKGAELLNPSRRRKALVIAKHIQEQAEKMRLLRFVQE